MVKDLRGHPPDCASERPGSACDDPGKAEVEKLGMATFLDEDVRTLEVAMDQHRRVYMEELECRADPHDDFVLLANARQCTARNVCVQWAAVHQFEYQDEVQELRVDDGPEKEDDIRMSHMPQNAELIGELQKMVCRLILRGLPGHLQCNLGTMEVAFDDDTKATGAEDIARVDPHVLRSQKPLLFGANPRHVLELLVDVRSVDLKDSASGRCRWHGLHIQAALRHVILLHLSDVGVHPTLYASEVGLELSNPELGLDPEGLLL
mmetsp:Transcript_2093/g.5238  ORF Transcript_2093/g.5238 Transcript_2093/m.5238 type:complete len:264 (+) Transcript_2093:237-1028(+)